MEMPMQPHDAAHPLEEDRTALPLPRDLLADDERAHRRGHDDVRLSGKSAAQGRRDLGCQVRILQYTGGLHVEGAVQAVRQLEMPRLYRSMLLKYPQYVQPIVAAHHFLPHVSLRSIGSRAVPR